MSGLPHRPSEGAAPTADMIVAAAPSEPLLGRRMWLVTFTDLVSLLLAFFILLYAMSWIDEDRWQATADSLTRTLDPHRADEQVPTGQRAVERDAAMPRDLDYLAAVLARNLAQEPALAAARLTRRPDAVVLSLPGDAADAATLTALGGLLRNVDNPVSVVGHAPDLTGTAWGAWHRALALAEATADALRRGGYDRPMAIRGRVHEAAVGRVDIALRDMQRAMEKAR